MNKKYTKNELSELWGKLERREKNRYDIVARGDKIRVRVRDDNTVVMDVPQNGDKDYKSHEITDHCHSQISAKTRINKAYYDRMWNEKPWLLAQNVNAWLPDKELRMIRVADDKTIALLSNYYGIINDYSAMKVALNEFLKIEEERKMHLEFKKAQITDRKLFLKVTSPELVDEVSDGKIKGGEGTVNGGIIVSNSEVGCGNFSVELFMDVLICTNGLVHHDALKRRHVGRRLDEGLIDWSDDIRKAEHELLCKKLAEFIQKSFDAKKFHTWVDEINKEASTEIDDPIVAINNIVNTFDLPKERNKQILDRFIKDKKAETTSKWDLSMAVTRIAHDDEIIPNMEEQIHLEKVGTGILRMKKKDLEKVEEQIEVITEEEG